MNAASTAYTIHVDGHLSDHWSSRLGDVTMHHHDDGTTTISVSVADQTQLHGVLGGLRDIGVTLLALRRSGSTASPTDSRRRTGPRRS